MSMKYLKGNIFTALHRERHACSTHEIFLNSLEELNDVFHRNSYPIRLIESRINFFLSNDQKPEREPSDITLVFDYTSPHIEQYICRLARRMSNILSNFRVNIAYRTIKVTKMFSCHAKQKLSLKNRIIWFINFYALVMISTLAKLKDCSKFVSKITKDLARGVMFVNILKTVLNINIKRANML
jgi:hypothetical protein